MNATCLAFDTMVYGAHNPHITAANKMVDETGTHASIPVLDKRADSAHKLLSYYQQLGYELLIRTRSAYKLLVTQLPRDFFLRKFLRVERLRAGSAWGFRVKHTSNWFSHLGPSRACAKHTSGGRRFPSIGTAHNIWQQRRWQIWKDV